MTVDTNELRELAEAATPGPWKAEKYGITGAGDRDVVSWDYALNDTDRGSEGTDKEFIAAANPTTILALLDRLAAMTERAEKAEKALSDCAASVRYAGEAPVLEGGLAENIPASVGLALMRLKKRAEVAERERDEATVQMHGAGVRADNAERREAHIRTALAGAEATIAKLRDGFDVSEKARDRLSRQVIELRTHHGSRSEVERLEATIAKLREAMPSEDDIANIEEGIYADDRMTRYQLDRALNGLSKLQEAREIVDAPARLSPPSAPATNGGENG